MMGFGPTIGAVWEVGVFTPIRVDRAINVSAGAREQRADATPLKSGPEAGR